MIVIKIIGLNDNGRLALAKYRESAVDLGDYKSVTKNMSFREKANLIKKRMTFKAQLLAIKKADKTGEFNELKEEYFSDGILMVSFNPKLEYVKEAIESKKGYFDQLMFNFGANADDYLIEVKNE